MGEAGGERGLRAGGPRRSDRARPPAARSGASRKPSRPAPLPVAEDLDLRELADDVRRELRSLPPAVAERVGRHILMAGRLLAEDPDTAYQHSLAARRLAARLPAVREAVGITAYRTGRFAEALGELRAVRRLTGSPDHLPMMADCERGLGRPERALALAEDAAVARLDPAGRAEMRIVAAGARRDLGQLEAALQTLGDDPGLRSTTVADWTPRLWYAYADALLAAGRSAEAREWFSAVASVDDDGLTDAEERLAGLESRDADGEGAGRQPQPPD